MNVSLTPELEEYIQNKVSTGRYHSASEVIREALRLLQDNDTLREIKLEALRRDIAVGIEQADRGEVTTYTDETLGELAERIKATGRPGYPSSATTSAIFAKPGARRNTVTPCNVNDEEAAADIWAREMGNERV